MRQWILGQRVYTTITNLCRSHICRLLHGPSNHVLTSSEALRALSPFYLAVHPDLFSRFPKEKAVNEDSLKKLNSYLDALEDQDQAVQRTPARKPKPLNLTFFIHPKYDHVTSKGSSTPNTVGISLSAQSVGSAVHDILESCELSTHISSTTRTKLAKIKTSDQLQDHILSAYHQHSKQNSHVTSSDEEDRDYPDFETMFEKNVSKRYSMHQESINFKQWLETNIKVAESNSASSLHLRKENQILREEICRCYRVDGVRTDVEWTASTLRGHLQALKELLGHPEVESLLEDYGRNVTVCLGFKNFVDVNSCVHLNCEQTLQQWIRFFQHVKKELAALKEITILEKQLENTLLVEKFERPSCVSPQEYEALLASYLKHHLHSDPAIDDSSRSSTTIMLMPCEACDGPLVAENGTVVIPSSCRVDELLEFVRVNEAKIKERRDAHKRSVMEVSQALEECQKTLGLFSLTWKPTITDAQALSGCHQLLKLAKKDPSPQSPVNLDGHCVCLCTYYAVSSDGIIKIPWNFVSS